MPNVLITGSSSGIGLATAKYFQRKGWQVIASMRAPELSPELARLPNITLLKLDVTDAKSIDQAIKTVINKFGSLDVLINNAGYAVVGAFEYATAAQIEKQFATNVTGLMAVTQACLPYFRTQKQGTIINISSMAGRITLPYYSLYHSTKWAIEGFSESLQYELSQFNIKVKLVEPGAIKTDFYHRSLQVTTSQIATAYDQTVHQTLALYNGAGDRGGSADNVAKVIYKAATDKQNKLRYRAGRDASLLTMIKPFLGNRIWSYIMRRWIMKSTH